MPDQSFAPVNLEYLIGILLPLLPKALVNKRSAQQIRLLSRQMPLLSFGCFECYLNDPSHRVDFNISVNARINEHRLLLDWLKRSGQVPPAWKQIHAMIPFLEQWVSGNTPFDVLLRELWFVFDLPGRGSQHAIPWHYFGFLYHPFAFDNSLKAEMIRGLLPVLSKEVSRTWITRAKRFIASIDDRNILTAFGIQFHRQSNGIRMYLRFEDFSEVVKFLVEKKWPGDITLFEENVGLLCQGISPLGLTFDLKDEMQPSIGIEVWNNHNKPYSEMEKITRRFVDRGLCAAAVQKAFLSWEGEIILNNSPNRWVWENDLRENPSRIPSQVVIRKMARYFKIIYKERMPMQVKAYLYFDRPGKVN